MDLIRKYKISKILGNTDNLTPVEKEILRYSIDFFNHIIKQELKGEILNELHYVVNNKYNKVKEISTIKLLGNELSFSYKEEKNVEPINCLIDYLMNKYHNGKSISFNLNKSEIISDNEDEKECLHYCVIKLEIKTDEYN